jgi:hypothetical protein
MLAAVVVVVVELLLVAVALVALLLAVLVLVARLLPEAPAPALRVARLLPLLRLLARAQVKAHQPVVALLPDRAHLVVVALDRAHPVVEAELLQHLLNRQSFSAAMARSSP